MALAAKIRRSVVAFQTPASVFPMCGWKLKKSAANAYMWTGMGLARNTSVHCMDMCAELPEASCVRTWSAEMKALYDNYGSSSVIFNRE